MISSAPDFSQPEELEGMSRKETHQSAMAAGVPEISSIHLRECNLCLGGKNATRQIQTQRTPRISSLVVFIISIPLNHY